LNDTTLLGNSVSNKIRATVIWHRLHLCCSGISVVTLCSANFDWGLQLLPIFAIL